MLEIKDKKDCCGCGACASICPKGCITLVEDDEGFLYPQINKENCVKCGLCKKICPVANAKKDSLITPKAYGCHSKNKEEVLQSSSGGIFSLLAKHFYNSKGVVYGAAFVDAYNVAHIRTTSLEELDKLRRSKYVQSETGEIFKSVQKDLQDGLQVLFTGTNCQIAGLKAFLLKDYENLYTQDIICHGVPSRKVWNKYLKENKIGKDAEINFREKSTGWLKYNFCAKENGQTKILEPFNQNKYMEAFLSDCSLRPSCYDCKFKGVERYSDITLADFWGVDKTQKELYYESGTSVVFVHSKKGQKLFEKISNEIQSQEVDFVDVVCGNPSYLFSAKENKNRKAFFENLEKMKFKKLTKKYCELAASQKIKRTIKKIVKKLKKNA